MSDESLFREVDEEVRQEQFKKLWERYGNALVVLAFVVVAGVGGWKGWQYWQVKQSERAAETYFAADRLAASGKPDEALAQFATVDHAGFGQLSRLRQANLLAKQGKGDEAVKLYDAIAADSSAEASLRDVARIRAGYVLADTLKPDELLPRLGDFDKDGNPWRHAAREIFAIAAWRAADYTMAERYVNAIMSDPDAPGSVRQRAQTLSQLLAPLLAKK